MKIFLDSVGCRLNQSEIEMLARQFFLAGHQIIEDASQADIVVINTCAVTDAASSDSRQKIRQAARNSHARIISTGCWATIDPQGAARLPAVEWIIANAQKDEIVKLVNPDWSVSHADSQRNQYLLGKHRRTRAFIKVQDGCDNSCSYCITRIARGKGRSRGLEQVIEEVQLAVNAGVKEAVLTGAQLGSWGKDLYPPLRLIDLINGILEKTSIDRLRLSSVEPWEIHEDFFPLLENPRFCRHLHLPLQSGSSAVLKRMRRPITPEKYQDLISSIRKANKNVALSTDLIVGFPGETEAEFSETLKFVQCLQFAGGHVFSFSPRPQTQAASLPGQVSPGIKKERSRILRGMISDSAFHFRESQKNQIQKVLWEKSTPLEGGLFELEGLSDNYLRVTGISHDNLWNCISAVKLVEIQGKTSRGKIIGPCHTSLMRQSRVSD